MANFSIDYVDVDGKDISAEGSDGNAVEMKAVKKATKAAETGSDTEVVEMVRVYLFIPVIGSSNFRLFHFYKIV